MVKKEFTWKIVVLGDGSVGKTSLVSFYTKRTFQEFYMPTIGAQFSIKEVTLDENTTAKVFLWDVAGQSKFSMIRKMFYEKAAAAIFVFDVSNKASFESIETWKKDLVEVLGNNFPSAMIANKIDLEHQVTMEEGFERAADLGMAYYETSAKTGQNVDDAFTNVLLLLLDRMK